MSTLVNSNEKLDHFASIQHKKMDLRLITEAEELEVGAGFKREGFLMPQVYIPGE
jgi:hypothetical protein